MDAVALQTVAAEMRGDVGVASAALVTARQRFASGDPASIESCAFHLTRCYNVLEQMALRVARAFENHIGDETGWHTGLIRRLSIDIPGIRPRLFPQALHQPLQELRAFRHVFVHAYDLEMDPEKLALLLKYGESIAAAMPRAVEAFITGAAAENRIELPNAGG